MSRYYTESYISRLILLLYSTELYSIELRSSKRNVGKIDNVSLLSCTVYLSPLGKESLSVGNLSVRGAG